MAVANSSESISTDVLVIGGGINGTGIARDAAGRGLSVVLCEQEDLAQHTSSASTKLIHGGLRYLENYDFMLVRHALREREVLLRSAPHIIWPLRFVLPHHQGLRPRWLIRLGLFLYDHLGGRKLLPGSRSVNLLKHPAGDALKPEYTHAFEYSDCWVQDARLVILNARDAEKRGARILTRTRCTGLQRSGAHWCATLEDSRDGTERTIRARAVVNAAGPWVEEVLSLDRRSSSSSGIRLVKGSHIIVDKQFDHPYPYIFQNADGRVLFAIPYEGDYTLLGTTDVAVDTQPAKAHIDADEIDYICRAVSGYLKEPVTPSMVVWSYSGVRPLFDDNTGDVSKVTRDYVLQTDGTKPLIVSVFGGKITTYRRLAEELMATVCKHLGNTAAPWTEEAILPGGDLGTLDFSAFLAQCRIRYPWLDLALLTDYARNYGTDIHTIIGERSAMEELGDDFGGGLYEREAIYLLQTEWAETVDDILWRRTKKGLKASQQTAVRLEQWLSKQRVHAAA